jgi:hypothetical protein
VIRLFLVFFIVGMFLSLAALLYGTVSPDATAARLAAAGDFASSIGTIFGMALASLALLLYVEQESASKKLADTTWEHLLRLEEAFHAYASLFALQNNLDQQSEGPSDHRFIKLGTKELVEALENVRHGELYGVLSAHGQNWELPEAEDPAQMCLVLEANLRDDLERGCPDFPVSALYYGHILSKIIMGLNSGDIHRLVNERKLYPKPYDTMEKLHKSFVDQHTPTVQETPTR